MEREKLAQQLGIDYDPSTEQYSIGKNSIIDSDDPELRSEILCDSMMTIFGLYNINVVDVNFSSESTLFGNDKKNEKE